MTNAYDQARPRDSLAFILSRHGRPFGGSAPGGGWKALDEAAIDAHLDVDRDARFKPPSFIPLARNADQDLFGLRVTCGGLAPSYWMRNRFTVMDVSDFIPLERVFDSQALVGFKDGIRPRFRAILSGAAVDAQPNFGVRALFLEPLCIGVPDVPAIEYARQSYAALRVADPCVAACFGTDVQSAWNYRAWLDVQRVLLAEADMKALAVECVAIAFENAVYALTIKTAGLHWVAEAILTRFAIETEIRPMLLEMKSRPLLIPLVTVSAGMLTALLALQDKNVAKLWSAAQSDVKQIDAIAYNLGMAQCFGEEDPRKYEILRRYGLPLRL